MAPTSTPGKTIGKYIIEKTLGKGGMGQVFLAHDPVLGRKVALKAIQENITDADTLERFTHPSPAKPPQHLSGV